jgi:molybdate transport repressor ModE-like protein
VATAGGIPRDRWLAVEIRHLAALAAIAREGSFRGAADALGYVQSAVSQQLAQLERLVGERLVERERGSAPVALTEAGQLLLEHVEGILTQYDSARQQLASLTEGRTGTLRIGVFQSVGTRLLPRMLPTFASRCPDVQIAPTETAIDEPLFGLLDDGELDMAFCELPLPDGPFAGIELMRDPFVLVVPAGSELAQRDAPPEPAEIAAMPIIGYNHGRFQPQILAWLEASGLEPRFALRSDLNATVQSLVAGGIGVAISPLLTVDLTHPGTRVIALPVPPEPRVLALAWHRERPLPPAADSFREIAYAACRKEQRAMKRLLAGAGDEHPFVIPISPADDSEPNSP